MILHWRDPAKVASGGGLYQVAPVGVFQPSNDAPWNRANDFSLWRAITREMSEELLGSTENYRSDVRPIDYERWPFYADLKAARQTGTLRLYWLGLGIDPLTLVADMLTVAVFDEVLFDRTFTTLVTANDEGHILTDRLSDEATVGFPFNSATIERFATTDLSSRPGPPYYARHGSTALTCCPHRPDPYWPRGGLGVAHGAAGAWLGHQLPAAAHAVTGRVRSEEPGAAGYQMVRHGASG
jgi:hypothetical protein